jgi:hypothetical protein
MATQWPLVKARLLELLPTLNGWANVEVYNGPPVGDGVADAYCTVGYVPGDEHSGTGTTTLHGDGFQSSETGQILGQIVVASGDDGLETVEAAAFNLYDALDASVRADRRLGGVLSQEGTTDLQFDVLPIAQGDGAVTTVVFTLSYFTVT